LKSYSVSATGHEPEVVKAENWLGALGKALGKMGILVNLERLACEVMPNETVVARDVKTGMGFVIQQADDMGQLTPAPAIRRDEESGDPFSVENLPKSVFHANLSHDLRAPLNDIIGYAGLLVEEAQDLFDTDLMRDLRRIETGATDLLTLVNAGLEAARVDMGDVQLHADTFEASELLEDAGAAFEPELQKRQNSIELRGVDEVGWIKSDPQHLREALIELLRFSNMRVSNGIVYIDAENELDGDGRAWILMSISDSGFEYSNRELQGLFQVFSSTQGDTQKAAATIRRARSRDLVRTMGGDIFVRLGADGVPKITIRLPQER